MRTRIVSASVILLVFAPFLTSAATIAELQMQLATLMAQLSALQSQTPSTAVSQTNASCPNLSRNLSRGLSGPDVTQLQDFLITQKLLAADSATGFFGALTESAVKQFQCKSAGICSGSTATNGFGSVGPRTRHKIIESCGNVVVVKPPAVYVAPIAPVVPITSTANPGTSSTCTPLSVQTQVLTCPVGQTGSITLVRTSSCPGPIWSSWTTTGNTCAAAPVWNGVIDMGKVVSAFADRHPNQSKAVSYEYHTSGAYDMQINRVTERRAGDEILVATQYGALTIFTPVVITDTMVGYHNTGVIPIPSTSPYTWWDPMVPISARYVRTSDVGKQFLVARNRAYEQNMGSAPIIVSEGPIATILHEFGVKDFGGNIGPRWYLKVITDSSVTPTITAEWEVFDLGPSEGVYDPEYSMLEYGHTNIPGKGPSEHTLVRFGLVDSFNPDFSVQKAFIKTFAAPQSPLSAICSSSGTQAAFSWPSVSGASEYALRVNDTTNDALGCTSPSVSGAGGACIAPTDFVNDHVTSPVTLTVPRGKEMTWWIHPILSTGIGAATVGLPFTCN